MTISSAGRQASTPNGRKSMAPPGPPAEPRRALINIGFAHFDVSAENKVVSWVKNGPTVRIVVKENSGDAYGMLVRVWGESPGCKAGDVTPAYESPAGTTAYRLDVALSKPDGGPYTCEMTARALPSDIAAGTESADFTITVNP